MNSSDILPPWETFDYKHEDLIDSIKNLIDSGVCTKQEICIYTPENDSIHYVTLEKILQDHSLTNGGGFISWS